MNDPHANAGHVPLTGTDEIEAELQVILSFSEL